MEDINANRVFITGVSAGLGKALAKGYLQAGCTVHGISREVPDDLFDIGEFFHARVDLADLGNIGASLAPLVGDNGFDLVILNAGILGEFGDMARVGMETVRRVMDVNVWANKAILDFFITGDITLGQVVAISSGASRSGARGWNGYSISKAALNMLVQLYARELAGTHFCALAPGLVDSGMQEYLRGVKADERYPTLERLRKSHGTAAMPAPDEAAAQLMRFIPTLPTLCQSGAYVDIREHLPG